MTTSVFDGTCIVPDKPDNYDKLHSGKKYKADIRLEFYGEDVWEFLGFLYSCGFRDAIGVSDVDKRYIQFHWDNDNEDEYNQALEKLALEYGGKISRPFIKWY